MTNGGGSPTRLRFRSLSPRWTGIECRGGDLVITGSGISPPIVVSVGRCRGYWFLGDELAQPPDDVDDRPLTAVVPDRRFGLRTNAALAFSPPLTRAQVRLTDAATPAMPPVAVRNDDDPVDLLLVSVEPRKAFEFFRSVDVPYAFGPRALGGEQGGRNALVALRRRNRTRTLLGLVLLEAAAIVTVVHEWPRSSSHPSGVAVAVDRILAVVLPGVPLLAVPLALRIVRERRLRQVLDEMHGSAGPRAG